MPKGESTPRPPQHLFPLYQVSTQRRSDAFRHPLQTVNRRTLEPCRASPLLSNSWFSYKELNMTYNLLLMETNYVYHVVQPSLLSCSKIAITPKRNLIPSTPTSSPIINPNPVCFVHSMSLKSYFLLSISGLISSASCFHSLSKLHHG